MRRVKLFNSVYDHDIKKRVRKECGEGNFIQYGLDTEEGENGYASFTVGIIELDDGKVILEPVNWFEFIDKRNEE